MTFTVRRSPFAVHRSPFTVHRSPFDVQRLTFNVRRSNGCAASMAEGRPPVEAANVERERRTPNAKR